MVIDHEPIHPCIIGLCCMCVVCSFGCCDSVVPVSNIQIPAGNSIGVLKQSYYTNLIKKKEKNKKKQYINF